MPAFLRGMKATYHDRLVATHMLLERHSSKQIQKETDLKSTPISDLKKKISAILILAQEEVTFSFFQTTNFEKIYSYKNFFLSWRPL